MTTAEKEKEMLRFGVWCIFGLVCISAISIANFDNLIISSTKLIIANNEDSTILKIDTSLIPFVGMYVFGGISCYVLKRQIVTINKAN